MQNQNVVLHLFPWLEKDNKNTSDIFESTITKSYSEVSEYKKIKELFSSKNSDYECSDEEDENYQKFEIIYFESEILNSSLIDPNAHFYENQDDSVISDDLFFEEEKLCK